MYSGRGSGLRTGDRKCWKIEEVDRARMTWPGGCWSKDESNRSCLRSIPVRASGQTNCVSHCAGRLGYQLSRAPREHPLGRCRPDAMAAHLPFG